MIDQNSFNSLLSLKTSKETALSIYLKAKPGFVNLKPLKVEYKNLVKTLPQSTQKVLHKELNTISNLIQNTPPTGKDLAIFAVPGQIQPYTVDSSLHRNLITAKETYTLYPLVYAEQFTPTIMVTLIQREEVQLYKIDSDVKRLLYIKRKEEKREDRKGFFARAYGFRGGATGEERSKTDEQLNAFLKDSAEKVSKRIDDELAKLNHKHIEIIIGEPQYASIFSQKRPQTCQSHISLIGTILGYTQEKNLKKLTRGIAMQEFRKNLNEVVKEASAGGSKGGAISATHALQALQEGRVKDFVISVNSSLPGTICDKCGYALAASSQACPVCSGKTSKKEDITEEIFRLANKYADNTYLTAKPLSIRTPMVATFRY